MIPKSHLIDAVIVIVFIGILSVLIMSPTITQTFGYARFGEMISDFKSRPVLSGVIYTKGKVTTTTTAARMEHLFSYGMSRETIKQWYYKEFLARGWQLKTRTESAMIFCKEKIGITIYIGNGKGREIYWWYGHTPDCRPIYGLE
ncbi:MAG: hypothetical protein Q7T36_02210 [Fluviicoccus sp.]|uniref:hypothetical protein n=1 Tax=Fluviicoccus sp. TaxID=2003552 RepID=UPI0027199603|nr:hypothetical protein [Fluviicoccus sp.]MDO8329266.1 hypothetical protein [Fluviicoccus sp.]